MKASAILRRARTRLVRDGWCQDAYHSADGSHCVLGAAAGRPGLEDVDPDLESTSGWYLELAIEQPSVVLWNDEPGRSADEVLWAVDEAKRIAESAEWTNEHFKEVA